MVNTTQAVHLTTDNFDTTLEQAKSDNKPVFVDFYADWCGPCKMAAPHIDKMAEEYTDKAVIAKVNVDDHNELAVRYQVMSIPTVVVFKNGEEVDRQIGFPGPDKYKQMVDSQLVA